MADAVVMHAVYWTLIHPIDSFWLKDFKLQGFGARFFGFAARRKSGRLPGWTELRDRWEYAHVVRAILGLLALAFLAASLVLG